MWLADRVSVRPRSPALTAALGAVRRPCLRLLAAVLSTGIRHAPAGCPDACPATRKGPRGHRFAGPRAARRSQPSDRYTSPDRARPPATDRDAKWAPAMRFPRPGRALSSFPGVAAGAAAVPSEPETPR